MGIMKKVFRAFIVPIAASASLFLIGCGSMSYTNKYPPTSATSVEVVSLGQLQKPYEIIGQYTGNPVLQDMLDWKREIAALGGDALSIPETLSNGYVKMYAIKWK